MRVLGVLGVVAALAACSPSSPRTAVTATPVASAPRASSAPVTPAPTYVSSVNALCERLQGQEQQIVQGFPPHVPVQSFLQDTRQIQPLLEGFDRDLRGLHPVTPEDQAAAAAFAAYVRESTDLRQRRVVAAQQGQAAYDAEYDRQVASYATDPVLLRVDALDFSGACHYR